MKKLSFLVITLFLFLAACGENYKEIEPNMSKTVADFSSITQDNQTFVLDDLDGEWWIADFIFTNCTSVCLPMTHNMTILQSKLKENNLDVQLVSFSVDPDYDSPEVLKEYAEEYGADLSNWSFLTGYDFQTIRELSIKSFQSLLQEAERGSDQVTHGTGFMLVSPDGKVIKVYDGLSAEEMDRIIHDLNLLKEHGHL